MLSPQRAVLWSMQRECLFHVEEGIEVSANAHRLQEVTKIIRIWLLVNCNQLTDSGGGGGSESKFGR